MCISQYDTCVLVSMLYGYMCISQYAVWIQIFESRKNCEVDPSRLTDNDNLESNLVSHILPQMLRLHTVARALYCFMLIRYLVPLHHQVYLVLG